MRWFSYKPHLMADTCHELQYTFRVTVASAFETKACRELIEEFLSDAEAGVAFDFGVDNDLGDDSYANTCSRAV